MFWNKRIFLDYAASVGNPSSPHAEGRAAKARLTAARTTIARELQIKADDIIFTAGATEANNIAIAGVVVSHVKKTGGDAHMLYLPSAHASIVKTAQELTAWGVSADPLPVKNGEVDIEAMKKLIRPNTVLVSMDFVCSETGTLWNTREVKHALPSYTYLHVDASQAPREENCDRSRIGADILVLDSAKVGNTRGAGILAAPRSVPVAPLMYGGGQERGIRPGTENVDAIVAFADALVVARENREGFTARAHIMRALLLSRVSSIHDLEVNQGKKGIAHVVNISLIGRDTDYLVALLDEAGFAVSTKSACESDSETGSRAVFTLTGDDARAKSTLRISWGRDVSERDLARFADALIKAVAFLDSHSI
jgi:cysteine desulfurase